VWKKKCKGIYISLSIHIPLLVEVYDTMCDFHLKGKCFHPEKVQKGLIAISCDVHSCSSCTNNEWQSKQIDEKFKYYQNLIELTHVNMELQPEGLPDIMPGEELTRKDTRKKIFGIL